MFSNSPRKASSYDWVHCTGTLFVFASLWTLDDFVDFLLSKGQQKDLKTTIEWYDCYIRKNLGTLA